MPVQEQCDQYGRVVRIDLVAGQRIRHTLREGVGATFQIRTEIPSTLMDSTGTYDWPKSTTDRPTANPARHTLSMAFGQPGKLGWRVELLDNTGRVVKLVKDCEYTWDGIGSPAFHATVEIDH